MPTLWSLENNLNAERLYRRKGFVLSGKQNAITGKLLEGDREVAKYAGYSFMQVKTVQMGRYEDYDATNHFYMSLGFKEFEVFPTLWDDRNPCKIYAMSF